MEQKLLLPFDLEKAKAGAKIKTKEGYDCRIICWDAIDKNFPEYCIVGLVKDYEGGENVHSFKKDGTCYANQCKNLYIVEEVEEPKIWRDKNCKVKEYYLGVDRKIHDDVVSFNKAVGYATPKEVDRETAMVRISHIMANDERFGGVITDEEWERDDEPKYAIDREFGEPQLSVCYTIYRFLAFHTQEQRKLFLEENEDLVKQYFMI